MRDPSTRRPLRKQPRVSDRDCARTWREMICRSRACRIFFAKGTSTVTEIEHGLFRRAIRPVAAECERPGEILGSHGLPSEFMMALTDWPLGPELGDHGARRRLARDRTTQSPKRLQLQDRADGGRGGDRGVTRPRSAGAGLMCPRAHGARDTGPTSGPYGYASRPIPSVR
jgi:hypothetical protein